MILRYLKALLFPLLLFAATAPLAHANDSAAMLARQRQAVKFLAENAAAFRQKLIWCELTSYAKREVKRMPSADAYISGNSKELTEHTKTFLEHKVRAREVRIPPPRDGGSGTTGVPSWAIRVQNAKVTPPTSAMANLTVAQAALGAATAGGATGVSADIHNAYSRVAQGLQETTQDLAAWGKAQEGLGTAPAFSTGSGNFDCNVDYPKMIQELDKRILTHSRLGSTHGFEKARQIWSYVYRDFAKKMDRKRLIDIKDCENSYENVDKSAAAIAEIVLTSAELGKQNSDMADTLTAHRQKLESARLNCGSAPARP